MSCNKCKNWQAIHKIRLSLEIAEDYIKEENWGLAKTAISLAKRDLLTLEGV